MIYDFSTKILFGYLSQKFKKDLCQNIAIHVTEMVKFQISLQLVKKISDICRHLVHLGGFLKDPPSKVHETL